LFVHTQRLEQPTDDYGSERRETVENFESRLGFVNAIELARLASAKAIRHTIQVSSKQVVYFEYPATNAQAETLLLIHGYRGNHRGLEAIAAGLSNFRVLIPDLPGFGESEELSASHSLENYSIWLGQFARTIGLDENLHLVGHSFGTLIVGHYATKNPVESVSLVNPVSTPALSGPRSALTKLTKIYYGLASMAPDFLGQLLLRSRISVMVMSVVMAKSKDKKLRRWIHAQHLSNFSDFATVRVATEAYKASISTDLSKLAPDISAPVLVVAAELDDITDIDSQRTVTRAYPNALLCEIAGVGHLVHYEAPDQAATFILDFLTRLR
jgi:pimeloyl-ACP methyl ester carboxylesterase